MNASESPIYPAPLPILEMNNWSLISSTCSLPAGALDTLFSRIRQLAPSARVYVVDYPNIIPNTDCEAQASLSDEDLQGLKSLVDPLDQGIQAATTRAGQNFFFVDMRPVWLGHEACSSDGWVNGVEATDPSGSYHPNAKGQRAYAQTLAQAIGSGAPAPAPSAGVA